MSRLVPWLLLTLFGCASTPAPAPAEYLLRPPVEESARPLQQPPGAALGRVTVAPYLDRPGIVVETGGPRIQVARNHRWAEPLPQALRRTLQLGIGQASGRAVADRQHEPGGAEVVVDVDVERLHGTLEGKVTLAANWQLRDARTGRVLGRHELVRSTLTGESGYDAMVSAQIDLLQALAQAIARTLESARAEP